MHDYLKALGDYTFPPRPWADLSIDAIFQDRFELVTWSYWIEYLNIKTYLEIGVAGGGLMHYLTNVLGLRARGIDIMRPRMVDEGLVFIGDSHAPETVKWALDNGPYDMVFIDADHTYQAVLRDWQLYGELATSTVVFHDIAHDVLHGPRQVWDEVRGRRLEIITPGASLGIGIAFC